MILYEYQEKFVQDIRAAFLAGHRHVLGVMPTGSGKTVCFANFAMRVTNKGKRSSILVHRDELTRQVGDALDETNVKHEVMGAGLYPKFTDPALIASVFTLIRRLDDTPVPDLAIIDEAHHAIGKTSWGKVINHWRRSLVLGVTATPVRLSGEGMDELFDVMVQGPTTGELIDDGYLSDYRLFSPSQIDTSDLHKRGGDWVKKELADVTDKPVITGNAIQHYKKYADGAPAVAFCVSVAHAEHVAEDFRASGYRAVSIDGRMKKSLRRNIIDDFRDHQIQVLTSCDLISEGFDCPGIQVGILLRNTQSLGLYLQQVGRCLRVCKGKDEAIILDHVGNSLMYGYPDRDHKWTLKGSGIPKDEGPGVKSCPHCFYVMKVTASRCPNCQHKFTGKGQARVIDEVSGELREVDPDTIIAKRAEQKQRRSEQFKAGTLDELIELGQKRGYKNAVGWAKHVHDARRKRSIRL